MTSESKKGGYELLFSYPPEELVCLICHHVAKEAHQVECCGKVFCETCIKSVSNDKCPNCKNSTLKIFCDRMSARRIKQLRLSCENEAMGCDWSGILDDYNNHITECGFVVVDCPNEGCKAKIPRNSLEKHCTSIIMSTMPGGLCLL